MNLAGGMQLIDTDSTITLSLRDSDVKQVLRMFADKAKMNIVFHNSVSGKVTLDLVDTQLNEAFDLEAISTNPSKSLKSPIPQFLFERTAYN